MKSADEIHEEVWEEGTACLGCSFLNCWQEYHPYGMGTAAETLCDCTVSKAIECPETLRRLEQQKNEHSQDNDQSE